MLALIIDLSIAQNFSIGFNSGEYGGILSSYHAFSRFLIAFSFDEILHYPLQW